MGAPARAWANCLKVGAGSAAAAAPSRSPPLTKHPSLESSRAPRSAATHYMLYLPCGHPLPVVWSATFRPIRPGSGLLYTFRLDRIENVVLTILNRAKGSAGGQAVARRIERTSSAEKEAELLAAQLQASRGRRRGLFAPNDPEAPALAEIEQEKAKRRASGESGDKLGA